MIEFVELSESLPEVGSLSLRHLSLDDGTLRSALFVDGKGLLPHRIPAELFLCHFEYIFNFCALIVKNVRGSLLLGEMRCFSLGEVVTLRFEEVLKVDSRE